MVKLFVGGFPLDMTEIELVQLVSPYGTVSTIKIVRDKKTRKCKGYAFLEITDQAGAEQIMEAIDGTAIGDRQFTVNIVVEKPVAPQRAFTKTEKPSYNTSYNTSSYVKVEKPTDVFKKKRPRKPM
jgi:RNA recognition motif-containing protein